MRIGRQFDGTDYFPDVKGTEIAVEDRSDAGPARADCFPDVKGTEIPDFDPATVLLTIVGAEPLDFKVPPIMEQAFGYRGALRFVEFSYSPLTHQFGYSDGGDHVPSDAQLWTEFVNHPLLWAEIGDDECPTLYGNFQHRTGRFCRELNRSNEEWHCLLIDRQQRRPYLCTTRQVALFFPLTATTTQCSGMVWSSARTTPSSTRHLTPKLLRQLNACLVNKVLNTFL